MRANKKLKLEFRHITMTILLLTFSSLTVFPQVTKQQLDNFYVNNQLKELEQIFHTLYNQTQTEFSKLSDNDTLMRINGIFNVMLSDQQKSETVYYFFLQSTYPQTFIDTNELTFSSNFIVSSIIENHRPLLNDDQTISEILRFLGSNPYDNPTVLEYLKDKKKIKKSKRKEAERLMADYNKKTNFIGQFLFLPATWGEIDRSLVPYKINSLKFNSDLTEVEIEYDLTWYGGTEIYKLVGGNWKKERAKTQWIH